MCVTDFIEHQLAKKEHWRKFGVGELDVAIERVNFPGRAREVIRQTPIGRELLEAHWGLVPSWAKDLKIGRNAYNARSETVAEKPMFRSAFKKRRCLLVGTSYCEWVEEEGKNVTVEFLVDGGELYAYAGLYEEWWGDGETVNLDDPYPSCTMLTCEPNETARVFNDRMPVIVAPDDFDLWLDPAASPRDLLAICQPCDAERLSVRRGRDPREIDKLYRAPA